MLLSGTLIFIIVPENADYFTDVHAVRRFCLIIGTDSVLRDLLEIQILPVNFLQIRVADALCKGHAMLRSYRG